MKPSDKKKFARNLTASVRDQFLAAVKSGEVPENWDGHEIRQWLADKFAAEVFRDVMKGRRLRDYKNTICTSTRL